MSSFLIKAKTVKEKKRKRHFIWIFHQNKAVKWCYQLETRLNITFSDPKHINYLSKYDVICKSTQLRHDLFSNQVTSLNKLLGISRMLPPHLPFLKTHTSFMTYNSLISKSWSILCLFRFSHLYTLDLHITVNPKY